MTPRTKKISIICITIIVLIVLFFAFWSPGKEAGILRACDKAVENLAERESIKLSVTTESEDRTTTSLVYYDRKDGKPRWYEAQEELDGKHEIFMAGQTLYWKYDPQNYEGIKVPWTQNTDTGLFSNVQEYKETMLEEIQYPDTIRNILGREQKKEDFTSIRKLDDGSYEFQYSDIALEAMRQARIAEASRKENWLQDIKEDSWSAEEKGLAKLTVEAGIRQAEEIREINKTKYIRLDQDGNLQSITYKNSTVIRTVLPDLETGSLNVSGEELIIEGNSVVEIAAVDDPEISEFLDIMERAVGEAAPDH